MSSIGGGGGGVGGRVFAARMTKAPGPVPVYSAPKTTSKERQLPSVATRVRGDAVDEMWRAQDHGVAGAQCHTQLEVNLSRVKSSRSRVHILVEKTTKSCPCACIRCRTKNLQNTETFARNHLPSRYELSCGCHGAGAHSRTFRIDSSRCTSTRVAAMLQQTRRNS